MNTSTRVLLPLAALAGLALTVSACAGSASAPHHPANAAAPATASTAPSSSSAAGSLPTTAAPAASTHLGPTATVRAYYRAINNHNYARAWHLGGRFTGSSYSAFAAGFQGTAHDKVSVLSVTGNVVTARLAARQTDGSVRTYQGTYWVTHGIITRFDVAPSSAAPPPPPPSSAAPAAGCHPLTPSGHCYEPGEYCPTADAGQTGVAGDGKTIVCVLESGRYHWHPVG
jgi:hypothetical protein